MFTDSFKIIALPFIFLLTACGGGGTSNNPYSNLESSLVFRVANNPQAGMIIDESSNKIWVSSVSNTNTSNRQVVERSAYKIVNNNTKISKGTDTVTNSEILIAEAVKPGAIPNGTFTYTGNSIFYYTKDVGLVGSTFRKLTAYGTATLQVSPELNTGQLQACANSCDEYLLVEINSINSSGLISGNGTFSSADLGYDYNRTGYIEGSTFYGSLGGGNAEEFSGISGGNSHSVAVVGTR